MSCLLPQFKWHPDTFSIQLKPVFRSSVSTTNIITHRKEHSYVRVQCALSNTATLISSATSTIVLDVEKLRLPSLETHSDSFAASRSRTYTVPIGPPTEADLEATLAAETLVTSDEAVIAAAAEEAITLAKAALKSAKNAALMLKNLDSSKANTRANNSSTDFSVELLKLDQASTSQLKESEGGLQEENLMQNDLKCFDELEPTIEELVHLQEQLSDSITIKSQRQVERKAKRAKAAEKSAAGVLSLKSESSGRKKRVSIQDVDYKDPLRYFRGTANSSRLLTATEEVELSAGVQDLLKLERIQEELKNRCGGEPTFAQWAAAAGVDQKTLRHRLNYGVLCKDKMVKSNVRLVISIAKKYHGSGMSLQDLVQEGCRGLIRGIEKYDASKGFKFSTYAHWWIKQAVHKALSDQSRTIRIPFHMVDATYRVKEARKHLFSENGKHPSNEEVAEATGLSMKRLNSVLMVPKAPRSLDQKFGINGNVKPSEVIADTDAETSEEILIKQFMKQDLEKVLDTALSPKEKQVVRWRFGLEDGRTKTLQEIGEMMGVSRERIRQIELSAFRKLKNKKKNKHLQQYLISSS